MTRRDWWLGMVVLVAALLLHAAWPRYEWRDPGGNTVSYVRIDRWTGGAQWGTFTHISGRAAGEWVSTEHQRQLRQEANTRPPAQPDQSRNLAPVESPGQPLRPAIKDPASLADVLREADEVLRELEASQNTSSKATTTPRPPSR